MAALGVSHTSTNLHPPSKHLPHSSTYLQLLSTHPHQSPPTFLIPLHNLPHASHYPLIPTITSHLLLAFIRIQLPSTYLQLTINISTYLPFSSDFAYILPTPTTTSITHNQWSWVSLNSKEWLLAKTWLSSKLLNKNINWNSCENVPFFPNGWQVNRAEWR